MQNNKGFTLFEVMIGFVVTFIVIIFVVIAIGIIGVAWELKSDMNGNNQNQVEIRESIDQGVNKKL